MGRLEELERRLTALEARHAALDDEYERTRPLGPKEFVEVVYAAFKASLRPYWMFSCAAIVVAYGIARVFVRFGG